MFLAIVERCYVKPLLKNKIWKHLSMLINLLRNELLETVS